jgi:Periplasmic glycine betaine/choline-binding (lipo)protein of an ABC-type transport system (osmoprotectant binding protein)
MRHPRTTAARLLAVLAAAALAITACGGGGGTAGGGGGGGSLAAVDLAGATFAVGSKEFTEQKVLGEIAVQALEAAGATVKPLASITGTTNVRTALTAGQIDMYWDTPAPAGRRTSSTSRRLRRRSRRSSTRPSRRRTSRRTRSSGWTRRR